MNNPNLLLGMRRFVNQYIRVLRVATKPSKDEFKAAVRITGIGIFLIGIIGFLIFLIFKLPGVLG